MAKRKLLRRQFLIKRVEAARKNDTLRPDGVMTYKQVMSLLHHCVLDSNGAEDLYWAIIEGLWLWRPEAKGWKPALLNRLREIAEADIDSDHARDIQVYNRCPECKRDDYYTYPSGVQECRCGEMWRPKSMRMRKDEAERDRQYQLA